MRWSFIGLSVLCFASVGACGGDGGSSGTGGTAGTGGTGGTSLCSTFCQRDAECFPSQQQPDCANWCADRLNMAGEISAQCLSAVEGTFECVNNLSSCGEVASWWNEDPADSYSCKTNDDAVDSNCFGG